MKLDPSLLERLVCPETGSRLQMASVSVVSALNAAIDKGKLKDKSGRALTERLSGALVRVQGDVAYPIVDDIPVLWPDAGVELDALGRSTSSP
jgi:uncharacterized protein YbaR (Trm112 family)